jgi:hypothetical protein
MFALCHIGFALLSVDSYFIHVFAFQIAHFRCHLTLTRPIAIVIPCTAFTAAYGGQNMFCYNNVACQYLLYSVCVN